MRSILLFPLRFLRNTALIIWLVLTGVLSVLVRLVTFNHRAGLWTVKNIYCRGFFLILGTKLSHSGLDTLDKSKTYVFTANHESYLDTQAIFMQYPHYLYFIAKKELKYVPVVGWVIWAMGMLFVDRKNKEAAKQSLQRAAEMIRNGKNVISFPEGTRSKTGDMKDFKKGLFNLALMAEVDVVPVSVIGAYEAMPPSTARLRGTPIHVHFGEPVDHRRFKGDPAEFAQEVKQIVQKNRDRLRENFGLVEKN